MLLNLTRRFTFQLILSGRKFSSFNFVQTLATIQVFQNKFDEQIKRNYYHLSKNNHLCGEFLLKSDGNINSNPFSMQKRFKKKNFGKRQSKNEKSLKDDEEEDENEDDDSDDEQQIDELSASGNVDTKVLNTTVPSLRLDVIGKTCFNIARNKFDECFYESLIRVNGERVAKKSYEVRQGDEIDLIRGFNINERERLDVNRTNIVKLDDKAASSGRFRITYKKTNKLTIDNYERDPYDGTLISTVTGDK